MRTPVEGIRTAGVGLATQARDLQGKAYRPAVPQASTVDVTSGRRGSRLQARLDACWRPTDVNEALIRKRNSEQDGPSSGRSAWMSPPRAHGQGQSTASTRQTVLPASSATSKEPSGRSASPTGRPYASPLSASAMKPVKKSSGAPLGWPPSNGTNTTL
jgi:hypothetical protein